MAKKYDYIKKGLTDTGFRQTPWTVLMGILIVICSVLYATRWFAVVGVNPNLTELGSDVFLKYMFIIVTVERAAAVFVGMFRSQSKVDWALRINRIREILQMENPSKSVLRQVYVRENRLIKKLEQSEIIGEIDDVPANPTVQDYLGYLTSSKHAYEFQRARFNSVSSKYVAQIVFVIGIILAMLGLSIFNDLLQNMNLVSVLAQEIKNGTYTETGLVWQTGLLRFTDIIITGGLLGGGSAGLNELSNKMTEYLTKQ